VLRPDRSFFLLMKGKSEEISENKENRMMKLEKVEISENKEDRIIKQDNKV